MSLSHLSASVSVILLLVAAGCASGPTRVPLDAVPPPLISSCEVIDWPTLTAPDGESVAVADDDHIEVTVDGPMARIELTRSFVATYGGAHDLVIPMPTDAALAGLTFDVGDGPVAGEFVEVHGSALPEPTQETQCRTLRLVLGTRVGAPIRVLVAWERTWPTDTLGRGHQWLHLERRAQLHAGLLRDTSLSIDTHDSPPRNLEPSDDVELDSQATPVHLVASPAVAARTVAVDVSGSTFLLDARVGRHWRALPDHVVVALDTSASIGDVGLASSIAVTRALRDLLPATTRLSLVHGDVWSTPCRAPLHECLDGHVAGGAADAHRLLADALREVGPDEHAVVVWLSDGRPRLGPHEPDRLVRALRRDGQTGARLYAVGVADDIDDEMLTTVSTAFGGNAMRPPAGASPETLAAALIAHWTAPDVHVLGVEAVRGRVEAVTGIGQAAPVIWGRILATPLTLDVTLQIGDDTLVERFEIPTLDMTPDVSSMSTRFWARARVAELAEVDPVLALEIAHEHNVVSPWTTLFVEGVEDARTRVEATPSARYYVAPQSTSTLGDADGDEIHDWDDLCPGEPGRLGVGDISGCPHTRTVTRPSYNLYNPAPTARPHRGPSRRHLVQFEPDSSPAARVAAVMSIPLEARTVEQTTHLIDALLELDRATEADAVLDAHREHYRDDAIGRDRLLSMPRALARYRDLAIDAVASGDASERLYFTLLDALIEQGDLDTVERLYVALPPSRARLQQVLSTLGEHAPTLARELFETWPFEGDLAARVVYGHRIAALAPQILTDGDAILADGTATASLIEMVLAIRLRDDEASARDWTTRACLTGRYALTECREWLGRAGAQLDALGDRLVDTRLRWLLDTGGARSDDAMLLETLAERLEASGAPVEAVLRLRSEALDESAGSRGAFVYATQALEYAPEDACRALDIMPRREQSATRLIREHPEASQTLTRCAHDLWLRHTSAEIVLWLEHSGPPDIHLGAMLAPAPSVRKRRLWAHNLGSLWHLNATSLYAYEVDRHDRLDMIWLRAEARDDAATHLAGQTVRGTLHVVTAPNTDDEAHREVPFALEVLVDPGDDELGQAITEVDL